MKFAAIGALLGFFFGIIFVFIFPELFQFGFLVENAYRNGTNNYNQLNYMGSAIFFIPNVGLIAGFILGLLLKLLIRK